VSRGLAVVALKHDAHGIVVDPAGKDSDVLFRSGADVVLRGPGESLLRVHGVRATGKPNSATQPDAPGARAADPADDSGARTRPRDAGFETLARELLERYDLVLVEGHKATPLPKIWLTSKDGETPPDDVTRVLAVLQRTPSRGESLLCAIDEWLPSAWRDAPIYAGVLVGGKSRRMGHTKALLEHEGTPFAERVVRELESRAEKVVFLGSGPVPDSCAALPRIPDPPGFAGPLAGILAALRWAPQATWIVAACDQPSVSPLAIDWLLDQRAPGRWMVLPRLSPEHVEPLLALYDARSRGVLEALARDGSLGPSALATHERTATPTPPSDLVSAWQNVNTQADLAKLRAPVVHPERYVRRSQD
jgi:molybdopterin-guanine dinucleotide biosynthesis protein A/molybdopterin-guanine dinucleotide biosynthesis protein